MEREKRESIAAFRFSVIYPLLAIKKEEWGLKEQELQKIISKEWEIPFSGRSYISRSTVLQWLKKYEASGRRIESLHPRGRSDVGLCRVIDEETELALINLRKDFMKATLPVLLRIARDRNIVPPDFKASNQTIYRILKRHGLDRERKSVGDMRKFEVELPNDLWQCDCMHGPRVIHEGRMRKAYLFTIIDDHSRLVPHAEFYLRENIDCFLDCFKKALRKRGLPRKLYTDNGASFRSHKLKYGCAALGIALIFAKPYRPQGKAKVERIHRTFRMQLLPTLKDGITLEELNARLFDYLEKDYHLRKHSSTGQTPLDRYLKAISLVRSAPTDLSDYFRKRIIRTVGNDRTVSIERRFYETPVGLAGEKVTLLYDEDDMSRIEVYHNQQSVGFLKTLNLNANSKVKRDNPDPEERDGYCGGALFGGDGS